MKRLTTPPGGIRSERARSRPVPQAAVRLCDGPPLPTLGVAFQSVPQRELAQVLARLVDSIPVPALVTDCSRALRVVYGNAAWRRWAGSSERPFEGKPLASVFGMVAENPFLPALWQVCQTGESAHFRDFECVGLTGFRLSLAGDVRRWDWDAFPLTGAEGQSTHLLVLVRDVTGAGGGRERAGAPRQPHHEELTSRERDVAVLIACGLRNPAIAGQLSISRTTVATHVTRILQKLGFTTRTQIAAWVVQQGISS